ncbi:hypothetical protein O181_021832 [Austropuccinia psidii MF-1]|uniref:Uncharacterized protein n=1 Tax=Austropuccinia psidii MF-1 TaxID=1389203 RepID=A0A9Q3CGA3_9BASI|nr:hypothetical protein [Austropuccinia psidii MF-1]
MSIASADAALLSAARAYASLKMTQHPSASSNSNSSNSFSANPLNSTATMSSTTITSTNETESPTPQDKQSFHYSRAQLLSLHQSPLCVKPVNLKPLKDWFGECDLNLINKSTSNHPGFIPGSGPQTPSFNSLSNQPSSNEMNTLPAASISQSNSNLPIFGRSQPPARNPFANFGKFGAEESNLSSFNIHFNGPANLINNPKPTRRLIDRDGPNHHLNRIDHLTLGENPRKRISDNINQVGKDRLTHPSKINQDHHSSIDLKSSNRRTIDRFLPDRDDDRSRDRDKSFRPTSNIRDGNLNVNGNSIDDHHLNWRRSNLNNSAHHHNNNNNHSQLFNNKRIISDHQPNQPRLERDNQDLKDKPHQVSSIRDKSNHSHQHSISSSQIRSNHHQNRNKEKEKDNLNPSFTNQLSPSTLPTQSSNPSSTLPSPSKLPKSFKDGNWDSGQGKWEISSNLNKNDLQGGTGLGSNETDAIQVWKAEMKALEAKKKQTSSVDSTALSTAHDKPSIESKSQDDSLDDHSSNVDHTNLIKTDSNNSIKSTDHQHQPNLNSSLQSNTSNDPPRKSFSLINVLTDQSIITCNDQKELTPNSNQLIEPDSTLLPKASRFAKFFDHHSKEDDSQTGSISKNSQYLNTDQQKDPNFNLLPRSASADPENMARVLSMLQMSSKQALEASSDSTLTSHSQIDSSVNKHLSTNPPSTHSSQDQLTNLLSQPKSSSNPFYHQNIQSSFAPTDFNRPTKTVDDPNSRRVENSNSTNSSSSTQFVGFRRPSSHSSPINQLRTLDDLSNHPDHYNSLSIGQSNSNGQTQATYLTSATNTSAQSSNGHSTNQQFGIYSTNQTSQLHSLLNSANSNHLQNLTHSDNQNLSLLTTQLQQQRLSPSHLINQPTSTSNMNSSQAQNALTSQSVPHQLSNNNRQNLSSIEQSNPLDHHRRFINHPGFQQQSQQPHPQIQSGISTINPILGGFSAGVPIVGPPPTLNGPHGLHLNQLSGPGGLIQLPPGTGPHSSLNNIFLGPQHQQPPAHHHPGILPPSAVNFASSSTGPNGLSNIRPGTSNFTNQPPQILPGLQPHGLSQSQQLQLQHLQQRQQNLSSGNFANPAISPVVGFPFLGAGPTNHGFNPGFGNVNFGMGPIVNNLNGAVGMIPPPPPPIAGLPNSGGVSVPQTGMTGANHHVSQQNSLASQNQQNHQMDLMSLLNAGNQRRIGM